MIGVHRTWLDPLGCGLAPIRAPHRSLGRQLGHGVRFGGFAAHLLVAGEGLETVLSVRAVLPRVPMRCSNSFCVDEFLRLEATDRVPDHSWLSKTRSRLSMRCMKRCSAGFWP